MYCKVCHHVVLEAKKYLDSVKENAPINLTGGRLDAAGKKSKNLIEYHTSEIAIDDAFEHICVRSSFSGYTENSKEQTFKLMVGNRPGDEHSDVPDLLDSSDATLHKLMNQALQAVTAGGPEKGDKVNMGGADICEKTCTTFLQREEDKLHKLFAEPDDGKINSVCQDLLKYEKCPKLDELPRDELYASYEAINPPKTEL